MSKDSHCSRFKRRSFVVPTLTSRVGRFAALSTVLFIGLWLAGGPAEATIIPTGDVDGTIDLPEYDLFSFTDPEVESDRAAAKASLEGRLGGIWEVPYWNPQTRTPRLALAGGVRVETFGDSDEAWTETALEVIGDLSDVIGVDPSGIRLSAVRRGLGKVVVHFDQVHQETLVEGSRVRIVFHETGALVGIGSDALADLTLPVSPSLSAEAARIRATANLGGTLPNTEDLARPELRIIRVPLAVDQIEPRLAWKLRFTTDDPGGRWTTFVDAHSGEVLSRQSEIHRAVEYSGKVTGDYEATSWCDTGRWRLNVPFPNARVRLQDEGIDLYTTYTDENGDWEVTDQDCPSCTGDLDLVVDFQGSLARVEDDAGDDAQIVQSIEQGVPEDVYFSRLHTTATDAERDVFMGVNLIHQAFADIDPDFTMFRTGVDVILNYDGTCSSYTDCNACWSDAIHFLPPGGTLGGETCSDFARVMSVTIHEYGHGVQHELGDVGFQLSEGNADVLAQLVLQDSRILLGMFVGPGCSFWARDAEISPDSDEWRYPDDVFDGNGDPEPKHYAGQTISAFHWDTYKNLGALYGDMDVGATEALRIFHFGRVLMQPHDGPDQVFASFIADDDDGNVLNGTPHFSQLESAALLHTYPVPTLTEGIIIGHSPVAVAVAGEETVVTASIVSLDDQIDNESAVLWLREEGGDFAPFSMHFEGGEYSAALPALTSPDRYEYYIAARDLSGHQKLEPSTAPDAVHRFEVAAIFSPMENDAGWTADGEGVDTATSGTWVRVDPTGTVAQPEDDHTPGPGTICWVTGNATEGAPVGEADVDGGSTSLYSPTYDLSGATIAKANYYRWFVNTVTEAGDDLWLVQVRNDGSPWVTVESTRESEGSWQSAEVDLLDLFHSEVGTVQFRFVASDDAADSIVEAAVDDFYIIADMGTAAHVTESATLHSTFLQTVRPNPSNGPSTIHFGISGTAPVSIRIYDVRGRFVRSLAEGEFDQGSHSLTWDGRDQQNRPTANGIYYVRMQTDGFRASQRVVHLSER